MNENEVIKQLVEIIGKVSLDKLGIKQKLEAELDRYSQFRYAVLGLKNDELEKKKDLDMKKYAKYILKEGKIFEKRELIEVVKNRLILRDKKLCLI